VDAALAGARLDVKYDPDVSEGGIRELFLFNGDSPAGIGRLVNFQGNAHRKRAGNSKPGERAEPALPEAAPLPPAGMKSHTISYADLQGGDAR
jgi:hypothetical protein